jgi:hypothetical protein
MLNLMERKGIARVLRVHLSPDALNITLPLRLEKQTSCRSTFIVLRHPYEFSLILRIPPQNHIIAKPSGTTDCYFSVGMFKNRTKPLIVLPE